MRSFLLLATVALVAAQFSQVFCDDFSSTEEDLLPETLEEIAKHAEANGVSQKTIKQRLVLVARLQELALWDYLTTIQQERLRTAIIKDSPVPSAWTRVTTYKGLIDPKNADVRQDLINIPAIREAMMTALPAIPSELEVSIASSSWWWKSLKDCQKKTLARHILRGYPQPAGFHSWNEAVYATNRFGKWIVEEIDKHFPHC